MTYDLRLEFDPPIARRRFHEHFRTRRHYAVGRAKIVYENPDTGVGVFLTCETSRSMLLSQTIDAVDIEINYFRPSFWGLEAEIEVAALVRAFSPTIEDPQIDGMGAGPYSREGFLAGWNLGNVFTVHAVREHRPGRPLPTLPAATLQAAWKWNYDRWDRAVASGKRQVVPFVSVIKVDGEPRTAAVWPLAAPILLPHVDFVMPGRAVGGEKRLGRVPLAEVLELANRVGFNALRPGITVEGYPLDLNYRDTPLEVQRWFEQIPLLEPDAIVRYGPHEVFDAELVGAARRLRTAPMPDP